MKYCLPILLATIMLSCNSKSETEKEKESIHNTLNTYLSGQLKEIDSTAHLDSVRIVHIDTVSSKDELKLKILDLQNSFDLLIQKSQSANKIYKLTADQYRALSYMNSLGSSRSDLSIFKDNLKEKQAEAQKIIDEMTVLANEVDSLKTIYFSNKIDSTNFLYYGVTYKMCYSDKNLVQECFDSSYLNITKDFRITKK